MKEINSQLSLNDYYYFELGHSGHCLQDIPNVKRNFYFCIYKLRITRK